MKKSKQRNFKIVNLDGYTIVLDDLNWNRLENLGDYTCYDRTEAHEIEERIKDADAVFTSKCKITRDLMERCKRLKFIGALATGYDNIEIEAARDLGIAVYNVPAYSTLAVAQHTFALILELTNNVGLHNRKVKEGKWSSCKDFTFMEQPIPQLSCMSLGIIGYGNIGKQVKKIAEAFGMEVNIYSQDKEKTMKSDIITLHLPLTHENTEFVNEDFISEMKDGAMLINTARGKLIKEEALANALKSGKLSGAAIDVMSKEPPSAEHIFYQIPNLIITPHIAWATKTARSTITEVSYENLKNYLEDNDLNRIV